MLTNELELRHVVTASTFFVGGNLIGLVLESIVTRKLRKRATRTSWGGETIVAAALHRVIVIWFTAAKTWAAMRQSAR